jgi:hypothetical protein
MEIRFKLYIWFIAKGTCVCPDSSASSNAATLTAMDKTPRRLWRKNRDAGIEHRQGLIERSHMQVTVIIDIFEIPRAIVPYFRRLRG